jgi:predicted outer membrane protein
MQTSTIAALFALTLVATASAEDQTTSDMAKFRAAYTSGDGLSADIH